MESVESAPPAGASWNPALRPDSAPLQDEPWESLISKVAQSRDSDVQEHESAAGPGSQDAPVAGTLPRHEEEEPSGAYADSNGITLPLHGGHNSHEPAAPALAESQNHGADFMPHSQIGEIMKEAQHQEQESFSELEVGHGQEAFPTFSHQHDVFHPDDDFFGSLQAGTAAPPEKEIVALEGREALIPSENSFAPQTEIPREADQAQSAFHFEGSGANDFFDQISPKQQVPQTNNAESAEATSANPAPEAPKEDLDAKWKAAFDDDELLEDEPAADPSRLFGDDDVGFLDDVNKPEKAPYGTSPSSMRGAAPERPPINTNVPSTSNISHDRRPSSSYSPMVGGTQWVNPAQRPPAAPNGYANSPYGSFGTPQGSPWGASPATDRPPIQHAQSFVDKAKGGYESPYDAPMDLSRPKRRPNVAQLQGRASPAVQAPPRSSSINSNTPAMYTPTSNASGSPGMGSMSGAVPQGPLATQLKPKASTSSFFEELPATAKPRTQSSTNRFVPPPSHPSPSIAPPPSRPPPPAAPPSQKDSSKPPTFADYGLVKPERVMPFADSASPPSAGSAPPASSARYSPALADQQQMLQADRRYSPAPPAQPPPDQGPNRYAASSTGPPRAPSVSHVMPFQPRTSSPLARSASASHQYVPSLQSAAPPVITDSAQPAIHRRASLRSAQAPPSLTSGGAPPATAPPPLVPRSSMQARGPNYQHPLEQSQIMSPAKQESDSLQPSMAAVAAPPQMTERSPIERPTVQSRGPPEPMKAQPIAEAYSVARQGIVPPQESHLLAASASAKDNFVPPGDGLEHDPFQRWQGAPILCFGFGGSIVTSFPQRIPRFTTGQRMPMLKCLPGEIRVSGPRVAPLSESLLSFPGPLKGKGKKKEVLEWLEGGIQRLSRPESRPNADHAARDQNKRHDERIVLWQVLKFLVVHDGNIDGNRAAESEVRKILSPDLALGSTANREPAGQNPMSPEASQPGDGGTTAVQGNPVHIDDLRKLLLQGEREKAVWQAVDQKLWGHAMLIASTLPQTVWKQVAQEFVRNDVKTAGTNNESLAALYDVFAGNWEESVDELVPPSARAGLQMVSKSVSGGQAKNALDGLDRWRETVSLIMNNRTAEDARSLAALGQLLLSYGRTEAAHVCFIFSKMNNLFGRPDDPQASAVLLGANHRQNKSYATDLDCVLLTEVYEYVYAVLSPAAVSTMTPYLQAFKLHHAEMLAEYGRREEALQYCDTIAATSKATTKSSPYHHNQLFSAAEELSARLRQSSKEGAGSWISRPSIDKVSGSVWNKFTQFVAGDDSDGASNASGKPEQDGPFAKINGDTPQSFSRSASPSQSFGQYGGMYAQPSAPGSTTNLRYAPTAAQSSQPKLSLDYGTPDSLSSSPPNALRKQAYAPQGGPRSTTSSYSPERERYRATPPVMSGSDSGAVSHERPLSHPLANQTSMANNVQAGVRPQSGFQEHLASNAGQHNGLQVPKGGPAPLDVPKKGTPSPLHDRNSPNYQPRTALYEPRSASYEPRAANYQPRSYEPSPSSESGMRSPAGAQASYEPQISEHRPEPQQEQASFSEAISPLSHQGYAPVRPMDASGGLGIQSATRATPMEESALGFHGQAHPPTDIAESGYEPPSYEAPVQTSQTGGYEPPTSSYEPPSYDAPGNDEEPSSPPRRRQMMELDDNDNYAAQSARLQADQAGRATSDVGPTSAPSGNSGSDRAARDRAADDAVRRAAEADAQRNRQGGGGWLSRLSLFGRGATPAPDANQPRAVRANLGESNKMYFDQNLGRWVNPNAPDEGPSASRPPPPPMGAAPLRPRSAGPPAPANDGNMLSAAQPPPGPHSAGSGPVSAAASRSASPQVGGSPHAGIDPTASGTPPVPAGGQPVAAGTPGLAPPRAPPISRPGTAVSTASNQSDIDDLIGAPQARRGGTVRRGRKKGGYVDVMAK